MTLRGQPPGRSVLTLDLVVATQILMQLAVRDIGQLTDIQAPQVPGNPCQIRSTKSGSSAATRLITRGSVAAAVDNASLAR